jgi:hypothetical protein
MTNIPRPGRAFVDDAFDAPDDSLNLHLWRRLDWRFLMPDPQPRTVGYAGPIDQESLRAIRLLDAGAADIERSAQLDDPRHGCDVVLLPVPTSENLRLAYTALRPGGWVCVQVRRSGPIRPGTRTIGGWHRAVRRTGFQDVNAYWHAPTLDSCSRIVRLNGAMGVGNTLKRHEGVRFGQAKSAVAKVVFRAGLLPFVVPEGTVIGRRSTPVRVQSP